VAYVHSRPRYDPAGHNFFHVDYAFTLTRLYVAGAQRWHGTLFDANSLPMVVAYTAANTHDSAMFIPLLNSIPAIRSRRRRSVPAGPAINSRAWTRFVRQTARMEAGKVAQLVTAALAAARVARQTDDWDEYGTLLWQAAADGGGSLPLGLELIASSDPVEREAGCDLLGHASNQNEAVRAETATALVALAQREGEGCVLWCLVRAIEMTYDLRAVPVLVTLAGHRDAEVRRQVATSFTGIATGLPDGPDIRALITLTRDQDPEVRNWATFTLGFQAEVDSRAIRAALWERTTDEYPDAREEGIRGLARRHDLRVVPLLAALLDNPEGAHVLTFRAAQIMGVPELLSALREYEPDVVEATAAVNACDPLQRAQMDTAAWDLVGALHRLRPDLDACVYMERFDYGLKLGLHATSGSAGYDVETLLIRAHGEPARAAELVASDLPTNSGHNS